MTTQTQDWTPQIVAEHLLTCYEWAKPHRVFGVLPDWKGEAARLEESGASYHATALWQLINLAEDWVEAEVYNLSVGSDECDSDAEAHDFRACDCYQFVAVDIIINEELNEELDHVNTIDTFIDGGLTYELAVIAAALSN